MSTTTASPIFTLLVVDDNPFNRRLLTRMLSKAGYTVHTAENGLQALQAVQKSVPDLILMDIVMPDMDGYEVCARLRECEQTTETPVIFVSALDEQGDMVKAFAVGGVDFIAKPFHTGEVLARVETHLTLAHLRQQLVTQNTKLKLEIEERRQVEEELRQATESAQVANRTKSQFLANMSHEVRTPMNGVLGMTELLLKTTLDERQQRYAQTIFQSSQSLLALLNDLLDFSKIEADRLALEPAPFNLHELANNNLTNIDARLQEKNLQSKLEIADSVPQWLEGDALRVGQIMCNLLSNAVKFTSTGYVEMHLSAEVENNKVILHGSIHDSGVGISQEAIDALFCPFSQADNSSTRQYGGIGLGLSISKHLIEMMDGKISVESTLGVGSIFHFWISLLPVTAPSMPKVLVLESDPVAGELLASLLENLGYAVDLAESLDATDRNSAYGVVLLDMALAEGPQAIAHFPPSTLLIGLHGNSKHQAELLGIQALIQRPVHAEAVQKKLGKWRPATK